MKYNESKFTKFVGSAGFYVIIACCLIAIGAASWFAVSRIRDNDILPDISSSNSSKQIGEKEPSSEQNIVSSTPDAESAANPVSDQPYESATSSVAAEYFAVPVKGNILKGYSDTELQYSATYGDLRLHTGADILCEVGTAVNCAGDGTVTYVDQGTSLGNVVTIDHGNGITVRYCGLGDITVKVGEKVKLGEVLGVVADIPSECADQSHIHIEVYKDGKITSPLKALGLG